MAIKNFLGTQILEKTKKKNISSDWVSSPDGPHVYNKYHIHPANAVYVGRGSPWGNPFVIGKDGTRDEVINRFCEEILPNLDVSMLKGRDLVCFCKPRRCHADYILKKANS